MALFKRAGSRIFGVQFNSKEQKAIDEEISRQCAEYDRKNADEIDALVLWVLHEKFHFGKKRLRAFHHYFSTEIEALVNRYQMDTGDSVWLCNQKLKDYGIDISEWNKEEDHEQEDHQGGTD
jgi:hypothetical protein